MTPPFVRSLLCSAILAGFVASAGAQELVTTDRVGAADAPNVLTMRANPNQSPNSPSDEQRAAFKEVWQAFAENHPDWQIQFEFFTTDIGGEHARLLEQARAGRAPDCVTVDSFQLALFIEAYHAVFVSSSWPKLETLAMLLAYTLASLLVGAKIFDGYRDTFPELV